MPAEVVRLGAWCDLVPEEESTASPGSVSFAVDEFAVLGDGRRVLLHQGERGFSVSGPASPTGHPLHGRTAEDIERDVLTTVLPDEDDGQEHPWEWLAGLLRPHGVLVRPDALRGVPYTVELSERLQHLCATAPAADRPDPPRGQTGSASSSTTTDSPSVSTCPGP